MNKKAAIELSANMIVVLVIAAVMLAMGLKMSTEFFTKAETMRLSIDSRTNDRISQLLDDGELVANPLNRLEIKSGQQGVFAIGVSNQLTDANDYNNFRIILTRGTTFPAIGCVHANIITTTSVGTMTGASQQINVAIRKNQKTTILIGVEVPRNAAQCTYVYDVQVQYLDGGGLPHQYANSIYKLYLKVI